MKKSTKIFLGIATIWPLIYVGLVVSIFSFMLLIPFAEDRLAGNCGSLDLVELTEKIQNGELKQLTIRRDEIVAKDRLKDCEYHTWVRNDYTRYEIIRKARELDATRRAPLVPLIDEESNQRFPFVFPVGVVVFFAAHGLTIVLTLALMPLYIVLAVKNDRLDQTTRILWIVLICLMGIVAMPAYWHLYLRRDPPANLASGNIPPSTENSLVAAP